VTPPLVSVVIATYNASHLLRYAIESVRLQDYPHFEIIVVGDHCTDDTEAVVASFADDRIRFINLERNSGQQATPNNVGVAAARGEYLAFLNHDDIYLPFHLSNSLATIRRVKTDIVCSAYPVILPCTQSAAVDDRIDAIGCGYEITGNFSPYTFHVASSWFLRREAALRVGPWKLEDRVWVTPSQDWLFRAWRGGLRIHCTQEMSIVALHMGARPDSYRRRDSAEHEKVFRAVISTDRRRAQVFMAAESWFRGILHASEKRRFPECWFDAVVLRRQWMLRTRSKHLRALLFLYRAFDRLLIWLGVHPNTRWAIGNWGWRRGELIRQQQRIVGLRQVID
jgi:glycosyltransferase involved in cell wall biosynthesis